MKLIDPELAPRAAEYLLGLPAGLESYPECQVRTELTREIFEAGKPVAYICHAGWVPISAGIVRGRRGTSVGAIKDDLVNAGMIWEDSPVVVDGNMITSRTPADLGPFCRAIIGALGD